MVQPPPPSGWTPVAGTIQGHPGAGRGVPQGMLAIHPPEPQPGEDHTARRTVQMVQLPELRGYPSGERTPRETPRNRPSRRTAAIVRETHAPVKCASRTAPARHAASGWKCGPVGEWWTGRQEGAVSCLPAGRRRQRRAEAATAPGRDFSEPRRPAAIRSAFQLEGINSATREAGCVSTRSITSRRYSKGSIS